MDNIRRLEVYRQFSDGSKQMVGLLAKNRQGVFFQYDNSYLSNGQSLSPFRLAFNSDVHKAPQSPHHGLHGVFADSLPDGWGLLLMDRVFRQNGIPSHSNSSLAHCSISSQSIRTTMAKTGHF